MLTCPLQTLNTGNLRLPFQRNANCLENTFQCGLAKPNTAPLPFIETNLKKGIFLYPLIFGASTGLLVGLSPEINSQINGGYIIPWARIGHLEKNVAAGLKEESEGGTGIAKGFYEWCENETMPYV